ncbi:uncharacterized protein LOC114580555 [Dendrobium catenatum]|uniref:uncharacterized protein LOC114580555 n=1 Tax=Dendrobium catenatum TaxID=906689 RepID=UPI0010A0A202|nr:uncharacterized protein LOC114580555 [Dendrobium catenatum]
MESSTHHFPPLSCSSLKSIHVNPLQDWSNIVNLVSFSSKDIPVSLYNEPDEVVVFPKAKTDVASEEWSLALVGYSVGRRPYYEALLAAIKKAWKLQGCSNSSPGPDGFNFHFYKTGWHIIGPHLCRAIQSFSLKGYITRSVKNTAIALIPKSNHAESILDFRPISLCNTLYKIITKILAARLKHIMPQIINTSQAGFINKRISTDNVILGSEILGFFKRCGRSNYMCAKLDIKKAFDSVSREFILLRLAQKGIPQEFIGWIKSCIMDVNFSICLDGALEGFIPSSSGLRQGCPLSPYLFCFAMDAFSNLLDSSLDGDVFEPFKIGDFKISHLLYADDVLVFGKANVNNCNTLTNLLSKFASSSGLVVNTHKSTLIMHPNTPNSNDICAALNIPQSHTKITYLGIPISIKKPSIIDFSPLIDVISNKLSGWKAKLLSFAGRLQFLRYTIWNTIAYWIRGAIIPKSCCKQIDKLASRFLYSGDANAKKLHLISWRNTYKPKVAGGLGVPSLNAIRFANSCSIISRMYNFPSLLANWFFHNYFSPWKPAGCLDSPMWKQICDTALKVKRNFAFKITVGSPISLMWDHWCWGDCLSSLPHVSGLKDLFPLNSNISVIMDGTVWQIPSFISDPILSRILSILIHQDGAVLYWNNGKIGRYSDFLSEFYSNDTVVGWHKVLWHKRAALRFSVFGWLSLVGGLKTADVLIKRCISVNPICCLCYSNVENVSHLYFECDYTHAIIAKLIPALNTFLLRPNLHQIVDFLADGNFILLGKRTFYPLLLWCTVYYIWRERNSRKFGNKFCSSTTTHHLIIKAVSQKIKSWKDGDIYKDILKRMH